MAQIPPDPKDYPGALPHMLYAGSLVFSPPPRVTNLKDWSQWWSFMIPVDRKTFHVQQNNPRRRGAIRQQGR
jgi:hypothetical protein